MAKVITLGEIMLRLTPPANGRFVQAASLDLCYGGGEANVAVSLAAFGHHSCFVSRLPQHEIGQGAVNFLRRYGVDTSFVNRGGARVGIYFLENGFAMRPSKVIYDRSHSSIAEAAVEDFDFDSIMQDADWFHWTGITPALSPSAALVTEAACRAAKRHGVTVSADLNYRKKLWSPEEAQAVMKPLMRFVDVCIGNEEDAAKCLGLTPDSDVETGNVSAEGYKDVCRAIADTYGCRCVASTLRESYSASHNGWKAIIFDGAVFHESRRYDILPIVDRVGAGDAFAGGLIHGLLKKDTPAEALEFAVAASALKHTIPGDFNIVTPEEVEALAAGSGNGRVER